MKQPYQILCESSIRALASSLSNNPRYLDRLLREGRMSLLLEAFTNEDATALADALNQQKKTTDEVAKALPDSMTNVKDLLVKLSAELSDVSNTSEIVQMSIKGDTKGLKKKLAKVNGVFMRVGNVTAAVVQTMIDAAENLEAVKPDLSDGQLKMTLSDWDIALKKTTGEEKKGYKEVKKILKAVIDSFGVPDWQKRAVEQGSAAAQKEAGGLWGAVKGFLGKIVGDSFVENAVVEGRGAFTEDLQAMSIEDIVKAKDDMTKAKAALEGTSKSGSEQTAVATADVAPSSEGEGTDEAESPGSSEVSGAEEQEAQKLGDELAQDIGKGPISKDELAMLLKRSGDITGSGKPARKARKAFRLAVNNAAGKEVFEEQRFYPESQLIAERWNRMAGLEVHNEED